MGAFCDVFTTPPIVTPGVLLLITAKRLTREKHPKVTKQPIKDELCLLGASINNPIPLLLHLGSHGNIQGYTGLNVTVYG